LYPNANSANAAGTFGTSYSWWEDGAVWKSLIDYWALTGDTQWNSLIQQAISTQAGPNKDFMPVNEIATEGNADQAIWALTAMSAVEQSFPAGNINYLALAQSVFDQQVGRWDTSSCGGGFHSTFNPDNQTTYSFKDAFSVGTFFQLAARLAQHTQNGTYTYWASKAYDWAANIGIINTGSYSINNGAETSTNCSSPTGLQWSANAGTFLYGCALMYNIVSSTQHQMS
jgi:mannan endo-1,6-alpha-mannosidase